jgi:DNA-directed RNA polymerase subunit RPC12/RpoP
MPRPVCADCKIEFRCLKNDIVAEQLADFGSYRLWAADLWICPDCGHKIIVGFGKEPIAERHEASYDDRLHSIAEHKLTKMQFKER